MVKRLSWTRAILDGFASINLTGYSPQLEERRREMFKPGYDRRMLDDAWRTVNQDLLAALETIERATKES